MTGGKKRAQPFAAQGILAALIGAELLAMSASSEDLFVRRAAGQVHVIAPRLHFLTGKSLQRLHDGATVPFDFQLSIAAGLKSNVVARAVDRFAVSYDVWEEKFRVVRLQNFRKSGSNLSANAAESWCMDNIAVPVSGLPAEKELWARLEIRAVEPKEPASSSDDAGISIPALIALLSRPPRAQQDHWSLESASFRLADLKQ